MLIQQILITHKRTFSFCLAFILEGLVLLCLTLRTDLQPISYTLSPIIIENISLSTIPKPVSRRLSKPLSKISALVIEPGTPMINSAIVPRQPSENIVAQSIEPQNASDDDSVDGIGTAISADQLPHGPIKLFGKEPQYPSSALASGIEASLKVKILVSKTGEVISVTLLEGPKQWGFLETINTTVKTWRFEPIFLEGRPVAFYIIKRFTFQLD